MRRNVYKYLMVINLGLPVWLLSEKKILFLVLVMENYLCGILNMLINLYVLQNISNSQNIITHIEVDNENKILFQTAEDGAIRFWDINNLSLIETIPSSGGHQPIWHCSRLANFEPNALLTAEGGDGNEIKHWDIRQRGLIQRFRGHEKDVRAAIFLQSQPQITSKRLMLSVSNDRTIRLWDVNNGKCIWTENNITAELNCCADFTNGRVVVCGRDATLCELRLMAKAGRPFCVVFLINALKIK
uniref:Uncharacterized protein n=1 Tax=Meloidogyne enterolobii TaxID=390850 RepID=A0A6V7VQU7_MELEN|nr:unnamed protein product [Meloidogyne enterolobii]